MTDVIDFGGTSLCRTESLIQSEIPKQTCRREDRRARAKVTHNE